MAPYFADSSLNYCCFIIYIWIGTGTLQLLLYFYTSSGNPSSIAISMPFVLGNVIGYDHYADVRVCKISNKHPQFHASCLVNIKWLLFGWTMWLLFMHILCNSIYLSRGLSFRQVELSDFKTTDRPHLFTVM